MKVLGNVIKSASDKRTYKAISLANQLQCLIVSDQEAQKSSAALSVGIGSLLDPVQAQGLAHYLQHMLFMGTQKYPQENDYMNFISKNSGSSNAYTSQQQTNFHFEVASNAFPETLDRFAQFFISPLMLQSSSQRQLNAVHSQHSKNLLNDAWRKFQITKFLAKEGHPYSKFSTGDKSSLGNPNLRKMLFDFYNNNYSANLMKMVVYGKEHVDFLSQLVEKQFSSIQNKNYKSYQMTQVPFDQKMLKNIIKLVPVKDRRTLEMNWILKNQTQNYKNSPAKYISHILGHQGKGSLLSFLISQGLANTLSAGGTDSYNCYSQFLISIGLTDKGLQNLKTVIGYVLYAVQQLKNLQPEKWIFQQIQSVYKMKFDFLQKKQGINYCSSIAKKLHTKSFEQILYYPYMMEQFKPNLIKDYLSQLTINNLIVMAESKTFQPQCNLIQPIYKSKFINQQIGQIQVKSYNFSLPQKNPFIPKDLTILPLGKQTLPRRLTDISPLIQAFYKLDHRFQLPKAQVNLRFYFDGQSNVKQDICRKLFEQMLKQHLRQFSYMAQTAELDSEVSFGSHFSLNIKVSGFRDSFSSYMNQYAKEILQFDVTDQKLFEVLKQKLVKTYANTLLGNPYQLAYQSIISALRDGFSTQPLHKLAVAPSITFNDVKSFGKSWKKKLYAQIYIAGNIKQEDAVALTKNVEKIMITHSSPMQKSSIGAIRAVFLPVNKISVVQEQLFSKQETNSSIIVHFQYEQMKIRTKILQDLALAFTKEPAFDYLRTKEQLGYIVMCLPDDHRGVMGLSILVQSNIKNSHQLTKYVDIFINQIMKQKINDLDEQTFNQYKNSLLSTKQQQDKTLENQCSRFWAQVVKHSYQFSRKEQQIELIPSITLDQFKNFLRFMFFQNPRRFQIHQIPQANRQKNTEIRNQRVVQNGNILVYSDLSSFRKKQLLYPDYYSHL